MLALVSFGLYFYAASRPYQPRVWQLSAMGLGWVYAAIIAWHFINRLPLGQLEFDGSQWYFSEKMGAISIRFDGQSCMLVRFQDDLNQSIWLWLEARSDSSEDHAIWYDLRRAVYSRPVNTQTLSTP